MSRMFANVGPRVNPMAMVCRHACPYRCWALEEIRKKPPLAKKYHSNTIVEHELRRIERAPKNEFIFIGSMTDMFGAWVEDEWIRQILGSVRKSEATVQFCTKNPANYLNFELLGNVVYGATIESDLPWPTGNAPSRMDRIIAMKKLDARKMVAVEPYMKWSLGFAAQILAIEPEFVHVGADNYDSPQLVGREPSLAEVRELIRILQGEGITVFEKTIREARATSMHDDGGGVVGA